jgi:hypothetical protein
MASSPLALIDRPWKEQGTQPVALEAGAIRSDDRRHVRRRMALRQRRQMSGMIGGVVVDRIAMRIIGRSEIERESCMRATVG